MEIYSVTQNFSLFQNEQNIGVFRNLIQEMKYWYTYITNSDYEQTKEFKLIHKIPNQVILYFIFF